MKKFVETIKTVMDELQREIEIYCAIQRFHKISSKSKVSEN